MPTFARASTSGGTDRSCPTGPSTATHGDGGDAGDEVYVAVCKEYRESELTLAWTLKSNPSWNTIGLLHVHRPSRLIPMMGGWFLPSQLDTKQVESFREFERENINKELDKFANLCASTKVQTKRLVIEADNVAKGLLELISQHGITRLVMGAAADKYHSRKMTSPKSKTASSVRKEAPPSCKIWFICKGRLISTRECPEVGYRISQPFRACPSAQSLVEQSRSTSSPPSNRLSSQMHYFINSRKPNGDTSVDGESVYSSTALVPGEANTPNTSVDGESVYSSTALVPSEANTPNTLMNEIGTFTNLTADSPRASANIRQQGVEAVNKFCNSVSKGKRSVDVSDREIFQSKHEIKEDADPSTGENQQDDFKLEDNDLYFQLQNALVEVARLKDKAYAESLKCQRAEMELLDVRKKVEVISRMRHPNLITLIGACLEAWSLVYEFLPNGSLEDRLACKGNTPPLPWEVRIHIITEICSALIFLHSNKPESIYHGDLRPGNILLDANFVSKITDFGIRGLVQSTTSPDHLTDPKGSFVYLDPAFFSSGELNACSDVYSFGIVMLRILTGRPALGIIKEVQEALDNNKPVLDTAAGNWPCMQAEKLVKLGLWCCELDRRSRPDLAQDVWKILAPIHKAMSLES